MKLPFHDPWLVLRLLLLVACTEFVRSGFFVVLLPLKSISLGEGLGAVGLLTSTHYLLDAVFKAPMALWVGRMGLGRVLLFAALWGLGSIWAILYLPFWVAICFSGVWGLGVSPLWAMVMTQVSHKAKAGQANQALNFANVMVAPGMVLGLVGMGQLHQLYPTLTLPVVLVGQVLAVLLAISLLGLPRDHITTQKPDLSKLKDVAVLAPAALLQTMIPSLFVPVLYPFLDAAGLKLLHLLPLIAVMLAVGVGSLFLAGQNKRFSPKTIVVMGLLGMLLCMIMLSLAQYGQLLAGYGYLSLAFMGVGFGLFLSGWNGLLAQNLPAEHRAAIWGAIMMLESLGYALGPSLGGWAWDTWGEKGAFFMAAALLLVAQGYYALVLRKQ